jgi:hypothetical protein
VDIEIRQSRRGFQSRDQMFDSESCSILRPRKKINQKINSEIAGLIVPTKRDCVVHDADGSQLLFATLGQINNQENVIWMRQRQLELSRQTAALLCWVLGRCAV